MFGLKNQLSMPCLLSQQQQKQLIDLYYDGKLTYAKAIEIAIKYRYDDDCINEGVAEMWWGYCNENKMLDFYFTDKTAHDYADSFVY